MIYLCTLKNRHIFLSYPRTLKKKEKLPNELPELLNFKIGKLRKETCAQNGET